MSNVIDLFDTFKVKIGGTEVNWIKDEIEDLRDFLLGYAYLRHHEPKLYIKYVNDDLFLVKLHDLQGYTENFPVLAKLSKHNKLFEGSSLENIEDVPNDTEEGLKLSIKIKENVKGR